MHTSSLLGHVNRDCALQMNLVELLQNLPVHLMACLATQQPQPTAAGMATTNACCHKKYMHAGSACRSGTALVSSLWALQVGLLCVMIQKELHLDLIQIQ